MKPTLVLRTYVLDTIIQKVFIYPVPLYINLNISWQSGRGRGGTIEPPTSQKGIFFHNKKHVGFYQKYYQTLTIISEFPLHMSDEIFSRKLTFNFKKEKKKNTHIPFGEFGRSTPAPPKRLRIK